jgi:hypothetical protein
MRSLRASVVLLIGVGSHFAALALLPAAVRAEASAYCPGACADAPDTACGADADCGGARCLFADACVPGDGALSPHGILRRGTYVHFTRGRGAQKALALAARGISHVNWYTYGPHQLTTGDGLAGLGEPSMESLAILQDGTRALALAEPALKGARRVTGPVAMLVAQSDQMWWRAEDDLWGYTQAIATDEVGAWLALTHGHHAVRFLVEERLPQDLDAATEVLIVQRRHLRNDAFAAIQAWVEAGGTLVLIGELPTHDEIGQRALERDVWLGTPIASPSSQARA